MNRRTLASAAILFLLIPATIWFGMTVLNDRKYYFISLLIIAYALIPFALIFEHRKPQARELVLIAVLAAIGVAGRAAFFMLPQFKPVVAVVILSGVCLGAEAGFLVGTIIGFVSNFFFGQGPWTPWQMFGFGLIGYVSGFLAQRGVLKKTKLALCLFGGFATFFIYGGLINLGSLLMFTAEFSWAALGATYLSGFWFDLIHTIATVTFLFLLSEPLIGKIERVKRKYGLLDPASKP
ncbi:ECF transporter S component [Xylanibacillus composti]|nr:ECF transporter S component [Xylanibacillus composti]